MNSWDGVAYPALARRAYAAAFDESIAFAGCVAVFLLVGPLEPPPWLIVALVGVFLLLEPFLVSRTGSSVGHHLFGLRVVDAVDGGHISFGRATLRMLARFLLGLPSLFVIQVTKRHQAIHDLLVRSVVVVPNPAALHPHDVRRERVVVDNGYIQPSRWRRMLIISVYCLALFLALAIGSAFLISDRCGLEDQCTKAETAVIFAISILFYTGMAVTIVYGWQGKLRGARRKKRSDPDAGMVDAQ